MLKKTEVFAFCSSNEDLQACAAEKILNSLKYDQSK